jgi:arylsulfatase A-like enzyme
MMAPARRGPVVSKLTATLLLFLAVGLCTSCEQERPHAPRNLLLITLDTTRADALSCLGGEPGTTPHIDELASRSTLFTHAVSETNVTNPSHLTILSGLRAVEHGVLSNLYRCPDDVDTLALAAGRAGARTAGFVATHHLGQSFGWQGFETLPEVATQLDAREVTDRALAWLDELDGEQPFFLWVHYFDPHTLYEPPADLAASAYDGAPSAGDGPRIVDQPYFDDFSNAGILAVRRWLGEARDPRWPRAMYAAELSDADRELGRLLDGLASAGRGEDTAVILTADHGESLGEHDIHYDHRGLHEPQLRVPLVVHVPSLPAGRSDALVSTLDVAPTASDVMGWPLQSPGVGLSLVPALGGEAVPALDRRTTFVHQNAKNLAVALRDGDWKLIWPVDLSHPQLPREPLLYHLGRDPEELHDLSAEEPERVAAMRARLEPWVRMGVVSADAPAHLDAAALQQLEELGYAGR